MISPLSSGSKSKVNKKPGRSRRQSYSNLLDLIFDLEDGTCTFLGNFGGLYRNAHYSIAAVRSGTEQQFDAGPRQHSSSWF
jgi:hypothetical protein